jgi:ABC-type nickel/cobalt efflux system permease component RcnA
MNFSQAWDAGFKSILIFAGVVFVWLGVIEKRFTEQSLSVTLMTLSALLVAAIYFYMTWRRCKAERLAADAEIRALQAGDNP